MPQGCQCSHSIMPCLRCSDFPVRTKSWAGVMNVLINRFRSISLEVPTSKWMAFSLCVTESLTPQPPCSLLLANNCFVYLLTLLYSSSISHSLIPASTQEPSSLHPVVLTNRLWCLLRQAGSEVGARKDFISPCLSCSCNPARSLPLKHWPTRSSWLMATITSTPSTHKKPSKRPRRGSWDLNSNESIKGSQCSLVPVPSPVTAAPLGRDKESVCGSARATQEPAESPEGRGGLENAAPNCHLRSLSSVSMVRATPLQSYFHLFFAFPKIRGSGRGEENLPKELLLERN